MSGAVYFLMRLPRRRENQQAIGTSLGHRLGSRGRGRSRGRSGRGRVSRGRRFAATAATLAKQAMDVKLMATATAATASRLRAAAAAVTVRQQALQLRQDSTATARAARRSALRSAGLRFARRLASRFAAAVQLGQLNALQHAKQLVAAPAARIAGRRARLGSLAARAATMQLQLAQQAVTTTRVTGATAARVVGQGHTAQAHRDHQSQTRLQGLH